MNAMRDWMQKASTKEQLELAKRAKTSRAYLYVLSNGSSAHSREARPALAARIERVTHALWMKNPSLPVVLRTDLNADCHNCSFAKQCGGVR